VVTAKKISKQKTYKNICSIEMFVLATSKQSLPMSSFPSGSTLQTICVAFESLTEHGFEAIVTEGDENLVPEKMNNCIMFCSSGKRLTSSVQSNQVETRVFH